MHLKSNKKSSIFYVKWIYIYLYVFFRYILDEYCAARRTALVGSFIDALTLGEGYGSTPNPIEMHANDPKRYIGDMLAWLHQVIPVEKENILTLVKGCNKTGMN